MSQQLSPGQNFVLSGTVALVSQTALHPFTRVKLLLQNQHEIIAAGRMTDPYKGASDCVKRTLHTEGVWSFWRGNVAGILVYFPAHALSFALKDVVNGLLGPPKPDEAKVARLLKRVTTGGIAGMMTTGVVYSMDYVHSRLANDVKAEAGSERQFKGLTDVYSKTLKSDGVRGLYRGFLVSCLGIFVYRGVYFGLYDFLISDDASLQASYALGFGATLAAGLIAYPFDTIRQRMMMRSCEPVKYEGAGDCAKQILKNEGYVSFFRGAAVSILKGFVGAGFLVGYGLIQRAYVSRGDGES